MPYEIEDLLKKAYTMGASDLHVSVNSRPTFRFNGGLRFEGEEVLTAENTEEMAKKLLGEMDWNQFLKTGDADLSYQLRNICRFRVNLFRQKQSVGIVARVIPKSIPSLLDLQMPSIIEELVQKPQGLILVTGPTGSGKTTTLAAMLKYINERESKHIITLEDPIEYIHPHNKSIVNQREIGIDTESFATGLRAALRQDPDIILVGEMRDLETISTAITAAETGHLVLATLHTNSAIQTINRIIDAFPPHQQSQIRTQLSSALAGIISQRLLLKAKSSGRIAATEILMNIPSVANLIRSEKVDQISNVLQTSRSIGMHTLEMSIRELVGKGEINVDYARNYLGEGDY